MRLNLALLAAALALAGGVAAWSLTQDATGESATYAVWAIGPEGALFHDNVSVEDATALSALQVAAARHGLPLTLEEYPGMGTYVRAIGPHRAAGASGWVYEVQRGGPAAQGGADGSADATSAWVSGDRSAADFALRQGDALRWSWSSP